MPPATGALVSRPSQLPPPGSRFRHGRRGPKPPGCRAMPPGRRSAHRQRPGCRRPNRAPCGLGPPTGRCGRRRPDGHGYPPARAEDHLGRADHGRACGTRPPEPAPRIVLPSSTTTRSGTTRSRYRPTAATRPAAPQPALITRTSGTNAHPRLNRQPELSEGHHVNVLHPEPTPRLHHHLALPGCPALPGVAGELARSRHGQERAVRPRAGGQKKNTAAGPANCRNDKEPSRPTSPAALGEPAWSRPSSSWPGWPRRPFTCAHIPSSFRQGSHQLTVGRDQGSAHACKYSTRHLTCPALPASPRPRRAARRA
jgi:hypothetical protein